MTPEEIDGIIEAMIPVCFLCAAMVDPTFDKIMCRNCWNHVKVHRLGSGHEVTSASFAVALGLTKGVKTLRTEEFGSESERMSSLEALIENVEQHTPARQCMLKSRFCALYLPALADALPVSSGRRSLFKQFEAFIYVLAWVYQSPFFVKFFLSNDPRASSGNKLATAIAEQILIYSVKWMPSLNDGTYGVSAHGNLMRAACGMLSMILALQVDKPSAIPIEENVRQPLIGFAQKWLRIQPTPQSELTEVEVLISYLMGNHGGLEPLRDLRDKTEGLQKCARRGCGETEDLWLCSRCKTVTYCGRKHQREHWNGTDQSDHEAGHKRVCYQSWF